MAYLATFDEILRRTYLLLGDAEEELRSDWRSDSGPSGEQARASREAQELISKAKAVLVRAAQ